MKEKIPLILVFVFAIFFSTFHLTESPPTWTDEGIIINTGRVLSETGHVGLQVAPNMVESAGVVTTSYPVTAPIALAFRMFGVGLLQARTVMVLFLIAFFVLVYFLLRKICIGESSEVAGNLGKAKGAGLELFFYLALFTIVSFPPIYGDGKNVLGEIPGLVFLMGSMICISKLGRRASSSKGNDSIFFYILTGLFVGLTVVTKPIFLLLLPALVGGWIIYFLSNKFVSQEELEQQIDYKKLIISLLFFAFVVIAWIKVQFNGDSLSHILSVYANPGKIDPWLTLINNIKVLISHGQSLYFLGLFGLWIASLIFRIKRRLKIDLVESVAFSFSLLVLLAFLRVPAYYRYFFLAQVLSLLYFLPNIRLFIKSRYITCSIFGILIIIHIYGLLFSSWVAQSYGSKQTSQLEKYFSAEANTTFYLWQSPELATFIRKGKYYQFFEVAPQLGVGSSTKSSLAENIPDKVIVHDDQVNNIPMNLLRGYVKDQSLGRYVIFKRQ